MASEAITQNDLREILSRTVGSVPSEYKKLLWTNPSPTSAMSGATIIASGADQYDAIEVVYKTAHIYNGYETALAPFVTGSHITLLAPAGTGGEFTGNIYNAVRTISMGAGGSLTADNAVGMTSSGTTTNNNMCIPYKVYGIKYERVAPPQLVQTSGYEIIKGSTGISTSGTTIYFDNTLDDYDFVLVGASWGVGGVVTGFLYVPIVWWTGTTDVIKVYLNNNPSNDSLTIGNRDKNKATISSTNANVACQVMGIRL